MHLEKQQIGSECLSALMTTLVVFVVWRNDFDDAVQADSLVKKSYKIIIFKIITRDIRSKGTEEKSAHCFVKP